jgi:hypothetical protein
MAHIEITLRDEQGNIINQATQMRYELGNRLSNLNEIERAVDQLKQAMLPALESDLLSQHQQEIIEEVKKKSIDKV